MPSPPQSSNTVSGVVTLSILGIDANYEPITLASYQYREAKVYPYFINKGYAITKVQGPLARRDNVAPMALRPEVDYITGAGHGTYRRFRGDHGESIFAIEEYQPEEVKGKIIHFLSCQTARDLGPDTVANGAQAFFGYDEDFSFQIADQEVFFECDSEIDLAFADGLTASLVYDRVKQLFNQRIAEFRTAGKLYEAATLEFNLAHLRCPSSGGAKWGDDNARLT